MLKCVHPLQSQGVSFKKNKKHHKCSEQLLQTMPIKESPQHCINFFNKSSAIYTTLKWYMYSFSSSRRWPEQRYNLVQWLNIQPTGLLFQTKISKSPYKVDIFEVNGFFFSSPKYLWFDITVVGLHFKTDAHGECFLEHQSLQSLNNSQSEIRIAVRLGLVVNNQIFKSK